MSYSNLLQTTLVPRSLYGKSENNNFSMNITPLGGIVIEANLLTTPFTGTISAAGISTTNPLGYNLLSTTNFNDQALTNIGSEVFFSGMSITDASGNSIITDILTETLTLSCQNIVLEGNTTINGGVDLNLGININFAGFNANNVGSTNYLSGMSIIDACNNFISSNTSTGDMTINCISNQLILDSSNNTTINAGVGFNVLAIDYIQLTANNDFISLQAKDDISLNSISKGIILTAGDGTTGTPDITLNSPYGNINLTALDIITISNSTGFTNSISLNSTTGDTTISSAFGSVYINSVEGNIGLNTGDGFQVSSNASITSSVGYTGKVYHTDQPTTALTYYLTFVQSGGVSGYYDPAFDSATLTYNPSTNLLFVNGLQLSGATIVGTFSAGILTLGCNESSSRQFQIGMTANITGLTLSNRRTNGVYTCSLYNVSGSTWTINNILTGTNKTDYNTAISIANGEFAVLTARTLLTNGTTYNYVSISKF